MTTRFAVTLFLLVLLGGIQAELWLGKGSVARVVELRSEVKTLQARNDAAKQRNEQLGAEVRDLQEGLEMVEEKARSELGMVKPDEIYVRIDPHGTAAN
jgi:cell division protein FtsB